MNPSDTIYVPNPNGGGEEITLKEFLRRGLSKDKVVLAFNVSSGGLDFLDGNGDTVATLTAEEALTYLTQAPQ
jgi:hypothetical protein